MEEKKRKELYRIILKEVEKYTPVADQTFLADLISFKVEQFIQAELDRAREEGILLGVFGKDNRCVEDKIVDLKYLHSMGEIGDKEYKKALSKLTTK